jgi:hypothetical protein
LAVRYTEVVVESIDPRSSGDYVLCTLQGGETLNVPRGDLHKEWLGFAIAAGRSVDCVTTARLEGLHPGATDDERSESSRRGVDDTKAISPRRQSDDADDDDDTPDEDSTSSVH